MRNASLPDGLRERLRADDPSTLCVAFSGGPDSTALLHALAQLPGVRARGMRALHVDHGLHPDSGNWAERCGEFCRLLDVSLTVVRVNVDDTRGEGIEAAARRARYTAFADSLGEGEWLVLAHHRDDQVETVLLKLLRGAGPEGLGGMRPLRVFAHGFLWRPLLETPRETLRNYLIEHALRPVEDPANADPRFGRNMLRREILPVLIRHWPHAEASILHAARLCRVASDHLANEADANLARLRHDDGTLDASGWLALPDALRAPALDAWLHALGLPAPNDAARVELERQTAAAAADRVPQVAWPDVEVRVWDGRLHAAAPLAPAPENWQSPWDGTPLILPPGCGELRLGASDLRLDPPLTVRFRHGGERIKPAGDPHTRELRDLFQQARIPPWLRARCPLVYEGGDLIAIADLWISQRGEAIFDACGARPCWMVPLKRERIHDS